MSRRPFDPFRVAKDDEPAGRTPALMTVSQLTDRLKQAVQAAFPPTVQVVGEISNVKRHSSGHLYFVLKDAFCELSCVMWRSQVATLKFQPVDGLEVVVTGSVEVYERAGRYQLYARKIEPRGVGAAQLAFRQLYEKLKREGLFDERHKQPLPAHPETVALVTSPTGAAVVDMVRTLQHRYPPVRILLYPVRVQGEGAAGEIARAVRRLNRCAASLGGIDVIIVGRGGGSLEDLGAFNEEAVARAIFASRIPVISAVGHEVDVTIADLVADVRAATPTAAATLAVPVRDEVWDELAAWEDRLTRGVRSRRALLSARLDALMQRRAFHDPLSLLHVRGQMLDETIDRVARALERRLTHSRTDLHRRESELQRILPQTRLTRAGRRVDDLAHRLRWVMMRRMKRVAERTGGVWHRVELAAPQRRIGGLRARTDELARRLSAAIAHRIRLDGERVRRQADKLTAMGYKSVLNRGFSITRLRRGGRIVRSADEVADGQVLVTEVADGRFESRVINRTQKELFD